MTQPEQEPDNIQKINGTPVILENMPHESITQLRQSCLESMFRACVEIQMIDDVLAERGEK